MKLFLPEVRANDLILNRAEARAHVEEHFGDAVGALQELVDYGTHLIPRCWIKSPRQLTDVVLLPVLLKQVVGLLDAAAVMHREGVSEPSLLQLRAAFEASVYIKWILRREAPRRAKAYYIWNIRRALKWARRARRGTEDYAALKREMGKLQLKTRLSDRHGQRLVNEEIARLTQFLHDPSNRGMNAAFTRRQGRRLYDPDWYHVLFPLKTRSRPTLYRLCRQVGLLAEYRMIYELGSESMHSSRTDAHVKVLEDGKIGIHSLRDLREMPLIAQLLMGVAIGTFIAILDHYRPDERSAFAEKYKERWRGIYLARRVVNYDYTEQVIG